MYIATVTCNRDFQQMLLQVESISKFVEPCTHVIVVNEDKPDLDFWYKWLKPYYTNHKLNIIPRIQYDHPISLPKAKGKYVQADATSIGWRTQQLQKMLLAYEFQDDYLLLDSKNFFTRKTNINEWCNIIGSGAFVQSTDTNHFTPSAKIYSELLNEPLEFYLKPQTPFKISRYPLITKCELSQLAYLLFYPESQGHPASEGIFYSCIAKDEMLQFHSSYNPDDRNYSTMWARNRADIPRMIFDITLSNKIKVSAVHRELLSKIDERELEILNFWITSDSPEFGLGLKNKIYPMPRDSYV